MARLFPNRDDSVDYLMVLRGSAVIGVLLGHLFGIGELSLGAIATKSTSGMFVRHSETFEWWRSALEIATPLLGLNFVVLFFVQSGYLMGKVFFEGKYDASNGKKRFYTARYLRLAPLLYFNLLVCIALFSGADLSPMMMAGDFLFINNFTDRGINLVTWSLSHEMQYYLVAPFVFLLFRRRDRAALIGVAALIGLAFFVSLYAWPISFVYAFLTGFAVNLLNHPTVSVRTKRLGLVVGLALLHFGFNLLSFAKYETAAVLFATFCSAALVWLCELPQRDKERASVVLRAGMFTGYLTYGIYLWHYVIIRTRVLNAQSIAQSLGLDFWATVVVFHLVSLALVLLLSYLLAYVTFRTIETTFRPGLYSAVRS